LRLDRELRAKLKPVTAPEDHVQMAQAHEEASFYLSMKERCVVEGLDEHDLFSEHQSFSNRI
jgi:hypothetical protein